MAKVEDEGYPATGKEIPYQWMNFVKDCHGIGYCASLKSLNAALIPPLRELFIPLLNSFNNIHQNIITTFQFQKS